MSWNPPIGWNWPLEVGKTWTKKYESTNHMTKRTNSYESTQKVEAHEEITVPAGSRVTFELTSRDVVHGFKIDDTPINVMVVPGQISKVTTTFDEPGEYLIVCHEYCGGGHHAMFGKVIVE